MPLQTAEPGCALKRGGRPFPMEETASIARLFMNEPWMGNRAWLEERPAHQWRNGSDLSKRLASDAPKKSFRERGPCHLPLLARGEVSGFGSLGPRFQVMGTWAQHGVPPQRDGVVDGGLPMDGEKTRGAGSQSQATSRTCSVGPSSCMDASDLDGLNLVSGHASDNQL